MPVNPHMPKQKQLSEDEWTLYSSLMSQTQTLEVKVSGEGEVFGIWMKTVLELWPEYPLLLNFSPWIQ